MIYFLMYIISPIMYKPGSETSRLYLSELGSARSSTTGNSHTFWSRACPDSIGE